MGNLLRHLLHLPHLGTVAPTHIPGTVGPQPRSGGIFPTPLSLPVVSGCLGYQRHPAQLPPHEARGLGRDGSRD